jgi:hypothetical protein
MISLCLGASTILCVAILVSSLLLAVLNPCTHDNPSSIIEYTRGVILPYLASFLLLAPAVVNLIFVIAWRASNDPQTTLRGRCHWDIDVIWSGVGLVCDRSPSFVSWLGGAISRLCITSVALVRPLDHKSTHSVLSLIHVYCADMRSLFQVTHHVVLHKYRTVCRVAEIIDRGPYTLFPKSVYADRRKSVTTAGSGRTRTSRPQSVADRAESISPPPSVYTHPEPTHRTQTNIGDDTLGTSHDEIGIPEGLAPSSPSHSRPPTSSAGQGFPPCEDADLHTFVNQFRRMVHRATRDAEGGLDYASSESSEDDDRGYLGGDPHEFDPYTEGNLLYDANGRPIEVSVDPSQVQVFGRMVHRMPTITSIGSGERSSRAPSRAYSGHPPPGERSLPSSRSNTVENDVAGQPLPRQGFH